ncbi:MAG: RluA family pseudouridine synthase [Gammaproteobacteria bacterium]|nr:RluA family pseudouridine synthase [Gammaproteobacteria bacterium]
MFEITTAQHGQRLDNFLRKQLGNVPRTRIYRIIRKGEVRVNKKRCKPDYKLQLGDQVRIPPIRIEKEPHDKSQPSQQLQQRLQQAILFENDHILIIDKPAGLAVHAGSGVDYGVIDAMRLLRPDEDIELVHRLDRDTSGCLLLSKHRQALLAMQSILQDRSLHKNYRVAVKGNWPRELIEINLPLKKIHLDNGERRVRVDKNGKMALTRISLLQSGRLFSLIQVELVTGRTHQIRVHCQAQGHEIAGDTKYGDTEFNRNMRRHKIRRLMLHASSLELPHSEFTPEVVINAPLPAEFELLSTMASGN